jgi:hypothetical protein
VLASPLVSDESTPLSLSDPLAPLPEDCLSQARQNAKSHVLESRPQFIAPVYPIADPLRINIVDWETILM